MSSASDGAGSAGPSATSSDVDEHEHDRNSVEEKRPESTQRAVRICPTPTFSKELATLIATTWAPPQSAPPPLSSLPPTQQPGKQMMLKHLPPANLHSPSSILGTPFDAVSRFEYPFPSPAATVDSALSSPELPYSPATSAGSQSNSSTSSYASLPLASPPLPSFTSSLASLSIPAHVPLPALAGLPILPTGRQIAAPPPVSAPLPSAAAPHPTSFAPIPAPVGILPLLPLTNAPHPYATDATPDGRSYSPTHPRLPAGARASPPVPPSLAAKKKRFSAALTLPPFGSLAADGLRLSEQQARLDPAQASTAAPSADSPERVETDLARMTAAIRAQLEGTGRKSQPTTPPAQVTGEKQKRELGPQRSSTSSSHDAVDGQARTVEQHRQDDHPKAASSTDGPLRDADDLAGVRPAMPPKEDSGETIKIKADADTTPGPPPSTEPTAQQQQQFSREPAKAKSASPPTSTEATTPRSPIGQRPVSRGRAISDVSPPPPPKPKLIKRLSAFVARAQPLLTLGSLGGGGNSGGRSPSLRRSPAPSPSPPQIAVATSIAPSSAQAPVVTLAREVQVQNSSPPAEVIKPTPGLPSVPLLQLNAASSLRHRKSFPGAVDQGRVGFGQETHPGRWL